MKKPAHHTTQRDVETRPNFFSKKNVCIYVHIYMHICMHTSKKQIPATFQFRAMKICEKSSKKVIYFHKFFLKQKNTNHDGASVLKSKSAGISRG